MGTKTTREDDERVLELLHLVDAEGLSFAQAGERLEMSRNKVAGLVTRVRRAEVPGCEERDGSLDPKWWRE